jgi:hypothetical protein
VKHALALERELRVHVMLQQTTECKPRDEVAGSKSDLEPICMDHKKLEKERRLKADIAIFASLHGL